MNPSPSITAAVTACRRTTRLATTLQALKRCEPPPAEILVHADGGDPGVIATIQEVCPEARLLTSETPVGPGGARNRLIAAASNDWVASFDDDARPLTAGYFATVADLTHRFPHAAILGASAVPSEGEWPDAMLVGVYAGYACVFNKVWFGKTSGFVPLPFAYCMEEVDLCLRLHALGGQVIQSPRLRVEHEADDPVDSVSFHRRALANIALFWFLRCPTAMTGRAAWQMLRRVVWLLKTCPSAILPGLASLPAHLQRHAQLRAPVNAIAFRDWLQLCRQPRPVPTADV